jgi:hypothetical protein
VAGDWIKVRLDLREDPAVVVMAERLRLDEDAVVGKLVRFWSWASRQSRDGYAPVTPLYLDRYIGVPGWCESLCAVGWLECDGDGAVRIPKWGRHLSQSAKARALAALRMARKRLRSRYARVTQKLPLEKRREEKSKTPPPPLRGGGGRRAQKAAAEKDAAQAEAARARRAEELRRQVHVEGALPPEQVRAALNGVVAAARRKAAPGGGEGT